MKHAPKNFDEAQYLRSRLLRRLQERFPGADYRLRVDTSKIVVFTSFGALEREVRSWDLPLPVVFKPWYGQGESV